MSEVLIIMSFGDLSGNLSNRYHRPAEDEITGSPPDLGKGASGPWPPSEPTHGGHEVSERQKLPPPMENHADPRSGSIPVSIITGRAYPGSDCGSIARDCAIGANPGKREYGGGNRMCSSAKGSHGNNVGGANVNMATCQYLHILRLTCSNDGSQHINAWSHPFLSPALQVTPRGYSWVLSAPLPTFREHMSVQCKH